MAKKFYIVKGRRHWNQNVFNIRVEDAINDSTFEQSSWMLAENQPFNSAAEAQTRIDEITARNVKTEKRGITKTTDEPVVETAETPVENTAEIKAKKPAKTTKAPKKK